MHTTDQYCFIFSKRLTGIASATEVILVSLDHYIWICGNLMIDIITNNPKYISISSWSTAIEFPVDCTEYKCVC